MSHARILDTIRFTECPKCGQSFTERRPMVRYERLAMGPNGEVMRVSCPECWYKWDEQPLDARGAEGAASPENFARQLGVAMLDEIIGKPIP